MPKVFMKVIHTAGQWKVARNRLGLLVSIYAGDVVQKGVYFKYRARLRTQNSKLHSLKSYRLKFLAKYGNAQNELCKIFVDVGSRESADLSTEVEFLTNSAK